jgi:hypothetical protein
MRINLIQKLESTLTEADVTLKNEVVELREKHLEALKLP